MNELGDTPTSINQLRQKLGRTGLVDPNDVRIIRAKPSEAPRVPGTTFYGWVTRVGNDFHTDSRGRIVIMLTDDALKSLRTAVETIGHELHHIREIRAGSGLSEQAAEAAGRRFWELFRGRLLHLK